MARADNSRASAKRGQKPRRSVRMTPWERATDVGLGPSSLPGGSEQPVELFIELYSRLFKDIATSLCIDSSTLAQDFITLQKRATSEGLEFLTKELPLLGKALDKALAQDCVLPEVPGFEKSKKGAWPVFLGPLWERIFMPNGELREPHCMVEPYSSETEFGQQVGAIRAVRQVTYLAYKLEGACSEESNIAAIENFLLIEDELPEVESTVRMSMQTARALDGAQILLAYVLKDVDLTNILPKHGPGSVATGELPWEKMDWKRFYTLLDREYPYSDYFYFSYGHLCDRLQELEELEVHPSACAKVCLVPKDSRGPRIISEEPLELQWIQQGQQSALYNHVENHWLTKGFVNFTNQEVNRNLALINSDRGELVTLDLKDASDRVSLWLVRRLFPRSLVRKLEASRSQFTKLPNGLRIVLKKFAPMGSAVCFPIEALTFWALSVASLVRIRSFSQLRERPLPAVYVYGDDLIVPKDGFDVIRPVFEELHLRFNEAKCCTGRYFRESCGRDAFRLHAVEPTRIKLLPVKPGRPASPSVDLHWIALANAFYQKGLHRTADFCRLVVSSTVPHPIPTARNSRENSAFIARDLDQHVLEMALRRLFRCRYDNDLQRWEIRIPSVRQKRFTRLREAWIALLRVFVRPGPPDPFGFDAQDAQCGAHTYHIPRQLTWGWSWRSLQDLLDRGD